MQGVEHYENFPVASWLCPPELRPPIAAIYHFARTADDLADEGQATPEQRLSDLATYRAALNQALTGSFTVGGPWSDVFLPLQSQIARRRLPVEPLHDLLSAFEQDVRYTAEDTRYPDMAGLLNYCSRSANPVGRLLLHLYGVNDNTSLQQSDAICSALQLINFWQDLSLDLPRQRHYLPLDALHKHGVNALDLHTRSNAPNDKAAEAMVQELVQHARQLMLTGAPLAVRLPGRVGWELRLVVQGGLRILDKIEQLQHRTWLQRPRLHAMDLPLMLLRASQMRG